jgi:hypothetical protein
MGLHDPAADRLTAKALSADNGPNMPASALAERVGWIDPADRLS